MRALHMIEGYQHQQKCLGKQMLADMNLKRVNVCEISSEKFMGNCRFGEGNRLKLFSDDCGKVQSSLKHQRFTAKFVH